MERMSMGEKTVKLVDELLSLSEELFQELLAEYRKTDKIQSRAMFDSALVKMQKMRVDRQLSLTKGGVSNG